MSVTLVTPAREAFAADALRTAPLLLGGTLTVTLPEGRVTVRITEVEAYHGLGAEGVHDPGSHARMGQTARNGVMFGEPGHLYVYFSYGMHSAVNVVCSPPTVPSGVLLRAGEVVEGVQLARSRRVAARTDIDLARGPGRLAQALGLRHPEHNGMDALGEGVARLRIRETPVPPESVSTGPRVGVSGEGGTEAFPWRFWLTDDPTVSPYRAAAARTTPSPTRARRT